MEVYGWENDGTGAFSDGKMMNDGTNLGIFPQTMRDNRRVWVKVYDPKLQIGDLKHALSNLRVTVVADFVARSGWKMGGRVRYLAEVMRTHQFQGDRELEVSRVGPGCQMWNPSNTLELDGAFKHYLYSQVEVI